MTQYEYIYINKKDNYKLERKKNNFNQGQNSVK